MKTIYLLRHAKSDWGDPALKDHDRPLERARARCGAADGRPISNPSGTSPTSMLCSTARRTVETFDLIKRRLGDGLERQIRGGSLSRRAAASDASGCAGSTTTLKSAMIIGHNPGMEQLANASAASPEDAAEEKLAPAHAREVFDLRACGDQGCR